MKNILLFASLLSLLGSCSFSEDPLKPISILEGEWTYKQDNSTGVEKWTQSNDSLMSGTNRIGGNLQEEIRIFRRNGKVIYSPVISGQTYEFELSKGELNDFKFVNEKHDFPKFIRYKFITIDSMDVSIGGGEQKEIHWQYRRVKKP